LQAQTISPSLPLTYSGKSNVTIENKIFTSATNGVNISLTNCSGFVIRNCVFKNTPAAISIQLNSSNDVQIYGCSFDSVRTGMYATNCTGNLLIQCNAFKDIIGPKPRGQMVQFNKCSGPVNRINKNILEQTNGVGNPEDFVNLYCSYGTAADPIQVSENKTRGGEPSPSGGGFMLGDNGSHDIVSNNNILVNPGQYGMAAQSGYNITMNNNTIFATSQPFTNVGLYVGLQSEINAGFDCVGNTISIKNNKVNWKNKNNAQNDLYICPCCPGVINTGNTLRAAISASIVSTVLKLDNTCNGLNLKCTVLGSACPSLPTEIEEEQIVESDKIKVTVQENLLLGFSSEITNLQLADMSGNVLNKIENSPEIKLNLNGLAQGLYILVSCNKKELNFINLSTNYQ
jgi:hypothetical protein